MDGTGRLVDNWLVPKCKGSLPLYRHKAAALQLRKRKDIPSAHGFLTEAYSQVDHNWHSAVAERRYYPSKENWRFTQRTQMAPHNSSEEVGLERRIIQAADDRCWANQVPTSSGLVSSASDSARNIDLVQRDDDQNYTFIELKVASNNPLFAAVEILLNGVLFLWTRNNAGKLYADRAMPPVLAAKSLTLCVLAPVEYYDCERLDLTHLNTSINQGLESFEYRSGIPCSFEFTVLGDKFNPKDSPEQSLQSAEKRRVIWQSA